MTEKYMHISRKFTKEDWESKEADYSGAIIYLVLSSSPIIVLITLTITTILQFTLETFFLTLALAFILASLVAFFTDVPDSRWYYIYRFPGAWWHHRKNNRSV